MDGHSHCLHLLAFHISNNFSEITGVNGVNLSRNVTSVVLNSIFDFGFNEKLYMAIGDKILLIGWNIKNLL